jgi:hypothetical protein
MAFVLRFEDGDHLPVVAQQEVHPARLAAARLFADQVDPTVRNLAALDEVVLALDLALSPPGELDLRVYELRPRVGFV